MLQDVSTGMYQKEKEEGYTVMSVKFSEINKVLTKTDAG